MQRFIHIIHTIYKESYLFGTSGFCVLNLQCVNTFQNINLMKVK